MEGYRIIIDIIKRLYSVLCGKRKEKEIRVMVSHHLDEVSCSISRDLIMT